MDNQELEQAIAEFTGAFQVVFGEEWEYSLSVLKCETAAVVRPGATLIEPGMNLDTCNWGTRAALLKSYQRLLSAMSDQGIQPAPPVRDTYYVYDWPERQ